MRRLHARREVDRIGKMNSDYKGAVQAVSDVDHIASRDDISQYVESGMKLPILLLTCNRAKLLELTLASLFGVRGISKGNVVVIQDGRQQDVQAVVESHGLKLIQNVPKQGQLRGSEDGATRIAKHYKFALTQMFDLFSSAPAVIIVEDDLLFSPDFLQYFEAVGPILDVDPSAFVVSSWSDNGYKNKVDDPYALSRTEFFPGLGWLLSRKLYKTELEGKWPQSHWDHWLRSIEINKGREIVFPQVPRTYHNGIQGTFMDLATHNRYFKNIAYNQNKAISWSSGSSVTAEPYSISGEEVKRLKGESSQIQEPLAAVTEPNSPIFSSAVLGVDIASAGVLCAWIDVDPDPPYGEPPFQSIARFFGLWHEHRRGAHKGLHEFYWEGKYLLLLNIHHQGSMRGKRHQGVRKSAQMQGEHIGDDGNYAALKPTAPKAGMSCSEVCAKASSHGHPMVCKEEFLYTANTCAVMSKYFDCSGGCHSSQNGFGAEQPAHVISIAPSRMHKPNSCLLSPRPADATCDSHHDMTERMCACVPNPT
eukprot:GSChrysophyteH1.ASY1.ANO1.3211.1 assembled CDS